MFYEQVIPVSPQRHGNWYVEGGLNYEFARKVNAVPLVAAEIPHAAREYTVVFTDAGDSVIPVAILGIKEKENLYVTDEGAWDAKYIPAFVRRYPFVFSKSGDRYTLCIDESWEGCNQEGRGQRLIDEKGERTPFLEKLMEFLKDYQQSAQRTAAYGEKLKELDLLEQKAATFTRASGEKISLKGFMAVNREKLHALPADKLQEMVQTGELEVTHAHLLSMNNLSLMLERGAAQRAHEPAAEGESPITPPGESEAEKQEGDAEKKPAKGRKSGGKS
jgi:hypothetical protein